MTTTENLVKYFATHPWWSDKIIRFATIKSTMDDFETPPETKLAVSKELLADLVTCLKKPPPLVAWNDVRLKLLAIAIDQLAFVDGNQDNLERRMKRWQRLMTDATRQAKRFHQQYGAPKSCTPDYDTAQRMALELSSNPKENQHV